MGFLDTSSTICIIKLGSVRQYAVGFEAKNLLYSDSRTHSSIEPKNPGKTWQHTDGVQKMDEIIKNSVRKCSVILATPTEEHISPSFKKQLSGNPETAGQLTGNP